jgi:hypothetical protein
MLQFPSAQRKIGFGYRLLMSLIAVSGLMVGERPHVRAASVVTVQPTRETQLACLSFLRAAGLCDSDDAGALTGD